VPKDQEKNVFEYVFRRYLTAASPKPDPLGSKAEMADP
jgi:hypothetical protein